METIESRQLSSELQELHLENKEWLSDVLFMEDEMRFLKKLFDRVITLAIHEQRIQELHPVNKSLAELGEKRQTLKLLIIKNQHLLESMLKHPEKVMSMELIAKNTQITEAIKALFLEEKAVKKDLFALAEQVFDGEHKSHLLTD